MGMFQLESRHLNKTSVEKHYYELLKQNNHGFECVGVTYDYRHRLCLINGYLKSVYGDLADWDVSIRNWISLMKSDPSYDPVNSIDDITVIDDEMIFNIISYDALTDSLAKEAMANVKKWKDHNKIQDLLNACDILGIYPRIHDNPGRPQLNRFLVNWPISENRIRSIQKTVRSDSQKLIILGMAVDMLAMAYNDQFYATFPFVGTLLVQPKSISYYRGENAYYGTARPSFYRSPLIRSMPYDLQQAVLKLKYDECGIRIWDKLQAAVEWTKRVSDCNYLALMQHYELPTEMIDITTNFKVALFFACCKWVGEGSLGHWEPLKKSDFNNFDSREVVSKLGGDSRYGLIYRTASEFEDLLWANVSLMDSEVIDKYNEIISENDRELLELWNHVVPVGYQAFNRGGIQSAYMFVNGDPEYDMLRDQRFSRYKFRLNENLCEWIYREMDKGDKIYPDKSSVPDITKYVRKVAQNPTVFSKSTFDDYVNMLGYNEVQTSDLRKRLLEYGYIISEHDIDYIDESTLEKINKGYSLDNVIEKYDIRGAGRPFFIVR